VAGVSDGAAVSFPKQPLAVVNATNLASAHGTGQYLAGLAALAFALAYNGRP
jgi:hypothetical protein